MRKKIIATAIKEEQGEEWVIEGTVTGIVEEEDLVAALSAMILMAIREKNDAVTVSQLKEMGRVITKRMVDLYGKDLPIEVSFL